MPDSARQPALPDTGRVFVLTGPSGVGKGTLCAALCQHFGERIRLSVSATTRPMRPGEQSGVDYFFKTRDEFQAMISAGDLLEWAEYNGHFYGTPKSFVSGQTAAGRHVLLEIETQGALQVKENFPEACLIFIEPPSLTVLQSRLALRGANTPEDIERRLAIARRELTQKAHFDFVVMNDQLAVCQRRVEEIIHSWMTVRA